MAQDTGKLARLETFSRLLLTGLHGVRRWVNYHRVSDERVDEHTNKTAILTMFVIFLEREYGRKDFDAFTLLAMAIIHDWGESSLGDIQWHMRRDPRVKKALDEIEGERLWDFLEEHLPKVITDELELLLGRLDKTDTVEGKLFHAIERMGYLTFAIHEVTREGRDEFVQVFRDHYDQAEALAQEFVSIRMIWEDMKKIIDPYLAQKPV